MGDILFRYVVREPLSKSRESKQVGNWRVSVSIRRKSKGKGLGALKHLLAFSRNGQNTSRGWN